MGSFSEMKFAWLSGVVERLRAGGMSDRDIVRKVGISPGALVNILRRGRVSDSVIDDFCEAFEPDGPVIVPEGMVVVDADEYRSLARMREALGVLVKELGNDSVI